MKKHKRYSFRFEIILLSGILAAFLCSCGGTDSNVSTAELGSVNLNDTGNHVSGTLCEGVTVDADIPDLSAVTEYDIVSVRQQLPKDEILDAMKDYVFEGCQPSEIKKEYSEEDLHTNFYIGSDDGLKERIFGITEQPGMQGVGWFNRSDFLGLDGFSYTYDHPVESQLISKGIISKDLDFLSQEKAVEKVKKKLTEWDVETVGQPTVFAVDGKKVLEWLNENPERFRTYDIPSDVKAEQLDCYYMLFGTGYQNIPYTFYDAAYGDGTYMSGARLTVVLTRDGIASMEYDRADYAVQKTVERHRKVITLGQALSVVQKRYEELIATEETCIPKIYFQYVPTEPDMENGSCTMVPAWVFQPAVQDGTAQEQYLDPIFVHAITGEIIIG